MTASLGRRDADRVARLIAALASDDGRLVARDDGRYEVRSGSLASPILAVPAHLVETMLRRDWFRGPGDGSFIVSEAAQAWLRRRHAVGDPWRGQHQVREAVDIAVDGAGKSRAEIVVNESPLTWLRRRKDGNGQPLVSDAQYRAGERLRAEFERGRMAPRVTADWTKPALDRGRRGPGSGAGDLLDSALSARRRVDTAYRALGPELGSLLLDVCCFLTGLEDAERRRGWPRRSATVVLGIALDRLAEHYGFSDVARGSDRSRRVLHWGADDYRPRIEDPPAEDEPVS